MWVFTAIWYTVEFTTYLCIIAYTAFTFGLLKPIKMKNDTPASINETWKSAEGFLKTGFDITKRVQKVLKEEEGAAADAE